jgi:hypothetical protein
MKSFKSMIENHDFKNYLNSDKPIEHKLMYLIKNCLIHSSKEKKFFQMYVEIQKYIEKNKILMDGIGIYKKDGIDEKDIK